MAKTMVQQFQENRREIADLVSNINASKKAKDMIGDYLVAVAVSAYATGFAHGSFDRQMTDEKWSLIVNETGNGTGNDFIREMIKDIQCDFHALGGVK
jgi:hypothetical protein